MGRKGITLGMGAVTRAHTILQMHCYSNLRLRLACQGHSIVPASLSAAAASGGRGVHSEAASVYGGSAGLPPVPHRVTADAPPPGRQPVLASGDALGGFVARRPTVHPICAQLFLIPLLLTLLFTHRRVA